MHLNLQGLTKGKAQIRPTFPILFGIFYINILLSTTNLNAQNCTVNAGIPRSFCANETVQLFGAVQGLPQMGTLLWTQVGGPSAIISNPNILNPTIIGAVGGSIYTFRISSRCSDGSFVFNDVVYTILETPQAIASGGGPAACAGNSYSITGNTPNPGETGLWSITPPGTGVSIDDVTNPNTFVTLSPGNGGIATLRWTVTNDITNCAAISNPITVTNCGGNSLVNAGPDQTLNGCYLVSTTATLSGSLEGFNGCGQQGMWTVVSGPNVPNIANPGSNNTGLSNLIEGTYVFRWTVSGPCVNGTDLMTLVVPPPRGTVTNAAISSAAGTTFCDMRSSVTLYGSTPDLINEQVSWIQTSGPAVSIASPNSPVTAINGFTSPGTYSFSYTITNPVIGCSSTSNVTLTFGVAPTVSITPDLINLPCSQTFVNIPYTQTGVGVTSWRFLSGPGIPSPTAYQLVGSGSPYLINGLQSGTYVVEFRRQAATGNQCPISTDVVTVVTSGLGALANAGTDQLLGCNIYQPMLAGNDPSVGGGLGTGTWYQISGPNTANIVNIHDFDTDINGLINGQYVFRWVISDGSFCNPNQDDVIVRVANVNPDVVTAGMDEIYCFGTVIYLEGNTPALNEIGTWTVFPTTGVMIDDIHAPNTSVTGMVANTAYTFTWTIVNSCAQASDEVIITTNATQGPVQANAGADQCLPLGTTSTTMSANATMGGTGTWTLISGPNTPTITNPNSPTTTITGLINGNYSFEWSIARGVGCAPTRDTLFVTISADVTPSAAGEDQAICGTETFLNANSPLVGTGTWTQTFGPGGAIIVSPNSPNTEITGMLPNASYTFRWTISNDGCSPGFDEVIVATSSPADAPNAGPDLSTCGGTSLALSALPVTFGYWTVVSGPNSPSFSDFNSPTSTVSNLIMGTYVLRWNSVGGSFCPALFDEMTIFVVPLADAGQDQFFCDVVSTVSLTGNAASTGVWTQQSGPAATITPTGQNSAAATGLTPGVYTFRYTINTPVGMNPCTSFDEMTVVLLDPPTVADAGTDQELCDQTIFNLSANTPVFGTGTWSVLATFPMGLSGTFTDPNNPSTTFTGAQPGIYLFEWTISNDQCTNADRVRIDNFPAPSMANAGSDFDACGTTAILNGNNPVTGVGNWTFISKPVGAPDPQILNPILYNSPLAGLEPGVYQFQWTISSGTICTPSSDIVSVSVTANPTQAVAGNDQALCPMVIPTSTLLAADPVLVGTGMWTIISGPGGAIFTDDSDPSTTINNLQLGSYVLRWTTTNGICSTFDEMSIIVSQQPTVADASATPVSLCLFEGVNLIGNVPVNGTGLWTWTAKPVGAPDPFILNPMNASTMVFGIVPGSYTFRWTISSPGCTDSFDEVTVTINPIPTQAQILMGNQDFCVTSGPLALLANEPAVGETGVWEIIPGLSAGMAVISNPGSYNTATVSGFTVSGSPAIYAVRWTINIGPCFSSDTIYVSVWDEPSMSNAGSDLDLCNVSSFNLTGNAPAIGTGVWTKVSGPAGTVTNPFSPATTVTGAVPGTYVFRWRISNGPACTPFSDEVTIINRSAMISSGPADVSVCDGAAPTLTVVASGGSGVYSYQWEASTTGCAGTWNTIIGAMSDTYNPGALTIGTYNYRVIITDVNGICPPVTSRCVTVTVVADPMINTDPLAIANICRGGSQVFTVAATGGTPSLTYQWQYFNGLTWNDVVNATPVGITYTNATSASMTVTTNNGTSIAGAYQYRVLVNAAGLDCNQAISNTAILNIYDDPTISVQPIGTTICKALLLCFL
ncbi:MAG: hypothetical protein IPI60_00930 [Saprospiraceae bacterium]|nr:hypothetical protein [Saprospiraceae bacterium]